MKHPDYSPSLSVPRCAVALCLAGCLISSPTSLVSADFSSPLTNVTVYLAGSTVTYQVADPVRGTTPSGSANAPGIVSAPVPSGGVVAWWADKVVSYRIYDVVRGTWVGGDVNRQDAVTVTDPQNRQGVAAFSADSTAYSAVYDPARGSWMLNAFATSANIVETRSSGGVAAWVSGTMVYYGAYESSTGEWRNQGAANPEATSIGDLTLSDGIVAWSAGTTVRCRIYDPDAGAWKEANVVGSGYVNELSIVNSTVSWTSGTQSYAIGYNPNTGTWQNGNPLPRAKFTLWPAAGNAPMVVWFTDLSIGGTSRSWTFGDGGTSVSRTPYHVFTDFQRYNVTNTVSGALGTHATNGVVLADTNPPAATFTINGGATYAPQTNVTLHLSASDNSGSIFKMRFANENTNSWSAWEDYATNKLWAVTPGDGVKTVYASFRDAAGNRSAPAATTITLYTHKPVVSCFTNNYVAAENSGLVTVTVVLDSTTVFRSEVDYTTVDGTATAPSDYTTTSGRLVFNPGQAAKNIQIPITDNTAPELNETFQVLLSNPTNIVVGGSATVTIEDNDPPTVAFANAAYSVGEDQGQAVIQALLSAASGRTVTVQYATQSGSAVAGVDYAGVTNRLTFVPGQTNRSFVVPILDDVVDEPDKMVLLNLSRPTNCVLGSLTNAVLNLVDDDPPTAFFGASTFYAAEPEGFIEIPVLLSSTYTQVVSVGYRTFNGSASVGSDYIAASGTLIFFPGQTNQSIPVTLLPDSLAESMETVFLVLTNFMVATPGEPNRATLNILDSASAAVLWAPSRPSTNAFQFTVIAPTGKVYAVETSTNLTNWAELSRFTQTNRTTGFRDTNATGFLQRFYRAKKLN